MKDNTTSIPLKVNDCTDYGTKVALEGELLRQLAKGGTVVRHFADFYDKLVAKFGKNFGTVKVADFNYGMTDVYFDTEQGCRVHMNQKGEFRVMVSRNVWALISDREVPVK